MHRLFRALPLLPATSSAGSQHLVAWLESLCCEFENFGKLLRISAIFGAHKSENLVRCHEKHRFFIDYQCKPQIFAASSNCLILDALKVREILRKFQNHNTHFQIIVQGARNQRERSLGPAEVPQTIDAPIRILQICQISLIWLYVPPSYALAVPS